MRRCENASMQDAEFEATMGTGIWQTKRNEAGATIDRQFTVEEARIKLKRLYRAILPRRATLGEVGIAWINQFVAEHGLPEFCWELGLRGGNVRRNAIGTTGAEGDAADGWVRPTECDASIEGSDLKFPANP